MLLATGPVRLTFLFCAPDSRRRDLDNMLASMKSAIDGIALALDMDDSKFSLVLARGAPVKGGQVEITIEDAA